MVSSIHLFLSFLLKNFFVIFDSSSFDSVKPLCRKIRGILFPLLEDGALFKGTLSDPSEKLYDPVIESFDSAIVDITLRQESG